MPRFPRTVRNTWPIGRGSSVAMRSLTDVITNEVAMRRSHPNPAVAPTPTKIAMGAALAAPAISSEMWAAESSIYARVRKCSIGIKRERTPCQCPHWCSESQHECPTVYIEAVTKRKSEGEETDHSSTLSYFRTVWMHRPLTPFCRQKRQVGQWLQQLLSQLFKRINVELPNEQ